MALISLGPWGGLGSNEWSYKASSGITKIVLRVGDNIKSISFRDARDQVSGTFGGQENDPNYRDEVITITWPSDYLKSISGTYETNDNGPAVITSLSFNTKKTAYGPFGDASGEHKFSIPIADSQVVGFHGSFGHYLNAIGITVKPTNSYGSISVGPWGGKGGIKFDYRAPFGINKIVINVGKGNEANIKAISFEDPTGINSKRIGGQQPDDIGEAQTVHIDWPSEHLISISGTYGKFSSEGPITITSLQFTTNRGIHGPFGANFGTHFFIPISQNTIVGFHGRAGDYLDAIGIFAAPETAI